MREPDRDAVISLSIAGAGSPLAPTAASGCVILNKALPASRFLTGVDCHYC